MQTLTRDRTAVYVSLELACEHADSSLYLQLARGAYTWPMSVLPLDRPHDEYLAGLRTGRKRAARAEALGYTVREFERADHQGDMNQINQSRSERQGRPMGAAYLADQEWPPLGEQPCPRHRHNVYGVFTARGRLVAYTVVARAGELALVSQILGHGDFETDGIMQLLVTEVYRHEVEQGGFLVYNRHDSGTDGLVQAKEWVGFRPMEIQWAP